MSVQALVHAINQFALNDINPVLAVLPDNGVVKYKQKYPEPMLSFSGSGLRAYYHCHESESQPGAEHGHFHIFLKIDDEHWSHLTGLSMDNLGQPIQWFTVNHWVTGETWKSAGALEQLLDELLEKDNQKLNPVENWLFAMLKFYQQALKHLLRERDRQINSFLHGKTLETILQDHTVYALSQYKINLLNDLKSYANLNEIESYHT